MSDAPARRRWAWALLVPAAIALLAYWATRPAQVGSALVAAAERATGLDIRVGSVREWRVRGGPRLVLTDLGARLPGATAPLLDADRIVVEVPWTTLRGDARMVERIELDGARLSLPVLRDWLRARPSTQPARLPAFRRGIVIRRGTLVGDGWRVERLHAIVPTFDPGKPVRASLRGDAVVGGNRTAFDLRASAASANAPVPLGIAGTLAGGAGDWRMRTFAVARARVAWDPLLRFDGTVVGLHGRATRRDVTLPVTAGLAADVVLREAVSLQKLGIALAGGPTLPNFAARGRASIGAAADIALHGVLRRWPSDWPTVPVLDPRRALPFALRYRGPTDLSGPAGLALQQDDARASAGFRLSHVLAWSAQDGSPIPPLHARASARELEIAGARLEGIEVEIDGLAR